MEKYEVILSKTARKQLNKLPLNVAQRLINAIEKLADNPRPHGYIKLTGVSLYRIWIGDYRIIYNIEDEILTVYVVELGNRREIYDDY
jgi:mRNA interferase RelE/StbE